jgi:hypothetical protein
MSDFAPVGQALLLLEISVALLIMIVSVVAAMVMLKGEYRDGPGWHVWFGAGIQGAIYGAIIGFAIVPLRFTLAAGEMPGAIAGVSGALAVVLIIAMRRGLFAHLPFLGPQVRAYRRAVLRRTIDHSSKQLERLMPTTEGGRI